LKIYLVVLKIGQVNIWRIYHVKKSESNQVTLLTRYMKWKYLVDQYFTL